MNPHNPNIVIPIEVLTTYCISGAPLSSRFIVNERKILAQVHGLEPADSVENNLNQHLRTLWEIESIECDTAQERKHDSEFIKEFENNLTFENDRYET
ncbi:hypothetical protein NPIL_383351 [Nephila pilipes]|uniref:Uncharacterized protein n=1 Tax=Nephila pilipes TaxID=299642 RepID=A0A8X6UQN5_NEPPI|nr:hypothetical protein NPIL_383351 [Nephila pilipes]